MQTLARLSLCRRLACFLLAISGFPAALHGQSQTDAAKAGEPLNWTTPQDHKNMMDQLGIIRLRPGPSGQPGATNSANYDPAKANPFPELPEVLTLKNGHKVTTAEMWWKQRRPEIVEDFEREVIGRVPKDVPKVTWTVVSNVTEGLVGNLAAQLLQLGWVKFRATGGNTLYCRLGGDATSVGGSSVLLPSEDNRSVLAMWAGLSAPQPPTTTFGPGCRIGHPLQ